MKPSAESVSRRLVPWLIAHRRGVLALAAVLGLASIFFSVKLYGDLRSDVEELLPAYAPSVVAARTMGPKLHTVTHLSIVLDGKDPEAMERFADDLAAKLRALPNHMVQSVEYRTDEQAAFVKQFGALYLSKGELQSILDEIDARIAWEKHHANPLLNLTGEDEGPAPKLDFAALSGKYAEATGALSQFRKGYYQTPDGHLLAMLVRPPEDVTGYASNKALADAVKREVEALKPTSYDPSMRVGFNGDVTSLVEEQEALMSDSASSTALVLIFVLLSLWFYFHRWTAILSISAALATSTAATFALGYFLVGHLNANTAFLGSIVVGNGINVSIIFVARYLEERRRKVETPEAIRMAWAGTLTATFVASFGAGLAYLSLASTDFRGFSQFGLIGGLGMGICWVGAYLLLPPLLAVIDARVDVAVTDAGRTPVLGGFIVKLVESRGAWIRAISLLLIGASVIGVVAYKGDLVEYDLGKLRTRSSARNGAVYWGARVDQVFKSYLTPIAIMAETPADLDKVVAALEARRKALGAADPIRELRTLENAIPPDQAEKLPLVQKLQATLTESRIDLLEPSVREKVRSLKPSQPVHAITLADLPASIRLPLLERDGSAGKVALVFPNVIGTLGPKQLNEITSLIRGSIDDSGAKAEAVGQALLFEDIATAILRDGPRATLLALILVCLLVVLVFRKLAPSVEVLGGLLLGVVWLVGAAAFAHVRLNFLNFVVLPITFGIGVDYAVNIVQRRRLEGPGSLARVLGETGGAVALCSATTIIGYASLLVADNRALAGFGLLASLGELACLFAALVALPAWIARFSHHAPELAGPAAAEPQEP